MSLVRLICGAVGGLAEGSLLGAKFIARSIISGGGGGGSSAGAAAASNGPPPPPSDLGGVGPDEAAGGSLSGNAGSELSDLLSDDVLDTDTLGGLEVLGGLYGDLGSSDLDPNTVLALLYAAFGLTAGGRGPGLEAAAAAQLSEAYVRYLGAWLAAHVGRGFVQLCRWLQPMQLSLLQLEAPLYASPVGQALHAALLLLPALVLALRLPWVRPVLSGAARGAWQRLRSALQASTSGSSGPAAAGRAAAAGGSGSGRAPGAQARAVNGSAAAAVSVGASSGLVLRSRDGSSVTFSFDEDDDGPSSARARSAAAEAVAAGPGAGAGAGAGRSGARRGASPPLASPASSSGSTVAAAVPAGAAAAAGRGAAAQQASSSNGPGSNGDEGASSQAASISGRAGQLAWRESSHAHVSATNGVPGPGPLPPLLQQQPQPHGGATRAYGAPGPSSAGAAAAAIASEAESTAAANAAAREESGRLAIQVLRAAGILGTAAALTVLPCGLVTSWGPWLLDMVVTAATAVASCCVFAMAWTLRGRQLLLQDDGQAALGFCHTLLLCRVCIGSMYAAQANDWALLLLLMSTGGNALRNCAMATAASESGAWADMANLVLPGFAAFVYAYSPRYLGAAAV